MKYILFVLLTCLYACGNVKEFMTTAEEETIIDEIPSIFMEEPTELFEKVTSINNIQGVNKRVCILQIFVIYIYNGY